MARAPGALRQVVRDYLRNNSLIVSMETPPAEGGGDGVTIARLSEE